MVTERRRGPHLGHEMGWQRRSENWLVKNQDDGAGDMSHPSHGEFAGIWAA